MKNMKEGINTGRFWKDEKGAVLAIALIMLGLFSLLGVSAVLTSSVDTKISGNYRAGIEAFYIAEAGIEHAKSVLKTISLDDALDGVDDDKNTTDDNGILSFGSSVSFNGGTYAVRVTDDDDGDGDAWDDSNNRVIITSTGTSANGSVRKIEVVVQKSSLGAGGIRAAVMANGPIKTLGSIRIDGRDHDIDGNLIPNSGTLGISTRSTYSQGGNSRVGGTYNGTDYAPSKPGNSNIIETNATWTAPTTPEEVLGLTQVDQLKTLAQSGIGGSQYVTDPANLAYPLSGITYVELPPGDKWIAGGFDFTGSGILIVHNSSTNAVLKNTNIGTFKGIIIVDDYIHIHNTIIGAVVNLTSNPSEGNCIGNGSGQVLYSSIAISNALSSISTSLNVISWRETS